MNMQKAIDSLIDFLRNKLEKMRLIFKRMRATGDTVVYEKPADPVVGNSANTVTHQPTQRELNRKRKSARLAELMKNN